MRRARGRQVVGLQTVGAGTRVARGTKVDVVLAPKARRASRRAG
jgi:hypothetical protein